MKRFTNKSIIVGLIVCLGLPALLWPFARTLIAARYLHRVPESVRHFVATPLPEALPAPELAVAAAQPTIWIPAINNQQLTFTPLPPTFTPLPTGIGGETAVTIPPSTVTPSPPPTMTPLPTATPLPAAVRIENITIIPQKYNNCGPANMTVVLDFYEHEADQVAIGAQIKPNYEDRNVSPWELVDYVNSSTTLQAASFVGGDKALLQQLLAAGYPVIIEKGLYPNSYDGWMGHYLTLVGYDDAEQAFISLDTFLGPWDSSGRLETYAFVDEFWHQFNNTFILIYPVEAETAVTNILGPTYQDPLIMWNHAAEIAQTKTVANPDDAFAWFNLGTSLTHLGELTGEITFSENAATAFDQARTIGLPWRMLWYQFEPYQAYLDANRPNEVIALTDAILTTEGGQNLEETHLYRGLAFELRGDSGMAESAFRRAKSLNPNVENR